MKKLLATLLTILTAVSAVFIPMGASAKTKIPNMYIGKYEIFTRANDYVYIKNSQSSSTGEEYEIMYVNSKGEETRIAYCGQDSHVFYMRGDEIYYNVLFPSNTIYSYNVKTHKNTKIYKNGEIIGGFGSNVIVRNKSNDYIYSVDKNKKAICLIKDKKCYGVRLFNGNIFYNDKNGDSYKVNLTTKEKTTSATKKQSYATKNYLYYINSKGNLTSLDKDGTKRNVDVKVKSIAGANDGKTVMYLKDNKLYRKTGDKKKVLLADLDTIKEALDIDTTLCDLEELRLSKAAICGNKAVFCVYGEMKYLDGSLNEYDDVDKYDGYNINYFVVTADKDGNNKQLVNRYHSDAYVEGININNDIISIRSRGIDSEMNYFKIIPIK